MTHFGHEGAEVRVKDMEDVVKEIGLKFEKLALGTVLLNAKGILTAYLIVNRGVDTIFTTTTSGTP